MPALKYGLISAAIIATIGAAGLAFFGKSQLAAVDSMNAEVRSPGPESMAISTAQAPVARALPEAAQHWEIPAANRVAGVESTSLASSPQEWLLTIPASDREVAGAFLERYADAYAFSSKEELAWMIDAGFPALEEVVAFRKLDSQVRSCILPGNRCTSSKVAALVADEAFETLAGLNDDDISDAEKAALSRLRLAGAFEQTAKSPSMLFALRVRASSAAARGFPEERDIALDLAWACGDYRSPIVGGSVYTALSMLNSRPSDACGITAPRPAR